MPIAYLSLGSNLGNRERYLREALRLLASDGLSVTRVSSIYETAPRDLLKQPAFLNLAAEIETSLSPDELLGRIRGVEEELGRQRTVPKGPRTIDIDILLYGDLRRATEDLTIPHPSMHLRRFVLEPLAELAPELAPPGAGRTVAELLEQVQDQEVRRVRTRAG